MALNSAQQAAVEYVAGPLLIVAGAGTGKTTVLTEKVAHLISSGLTKPEEILGLTFTDKAANELCGRVEERLNLPYSELTVSTFHLFCQRLLNEFALEIGLPRQFKVLTDTESWLLLRQNIYQLGLTYYRPLGNPAKYIPDLLRHFSKCKDELISPAQYLTHASQAPLEAVEDGLDERTRLTELATAYEQYNQLVLKAGGLDFGDLIYYAVKLLRERPRVREIIAKRYKYILVDEFQDVNWAQYELVRLLSEQAQLTVVGDDDQSVYAFRGASVSNILRFRDDYPQAHSVVLNENYRSYQGILDVAYTAIQHNNPDRLETRLELNKKLVADRKQTGIEPAVQCLQYSTLDDEVRAVINEIKRLKEADTSLTWADFAILGRANNHLEPFTQALEKAHIPFEFLSAAGLYRQPIVLDAYNFLKVIHQTRESAALFRLLHLPCLGLSSHDIQAIVAAGKRKNTTYYEVISQTELWGLSDSGQAAVHKLASLLQTAVAESKTAKPTTLLYQFLEGSGYLAYLAQAENSGDPFIIQQIFQLKQFFEIIVDFEANARNPHVAHFVEYLDSLIEAGEEGPLYRDQEAAEGVRVMSVHGSKGLEFRYVFVVNLVEERFPTRRRGDGLEIPTALVHESLVTGDAHYQEERRLFYVAATRARDALYLTSAANYGGVRAKKISRFVVEAGLAEAPVGKKTATATDLVRTAHAPATEIAPTAAPTYQTPREFSFSQIQSYLKCPYYYKLKHIISLPTKGAAHFSFGQTLHLTLQHFYEQVQTLNQATQSSLFAITPSTKADQIQVPTLAELLQDYEDTFINDWYESAEQRELYHQQGRDILKKFYAAQEGNWTVPFALEDSFKIQVGDAILKGKIDRLDQEPDGSLHIIDYKTGQPKQKLLPEDKDQLLIYQIATEALPKYRNLGPTKKLTFYYLNNSQPVSFEGQPEDLDRLRDKITNTVDRIRTGDFKATPSQFVCDHCEFKTICEFRAR